MSLVEREGLVEQLGSAIKAAKGGVGAFIAVSGEAGAGKTSLVREAVASTPSVWGEPLSTPRPLGLFQDIAREIWPQSTGADDLDVVGMRERPLEWMKDIPLSLIVEDKLHLSTKTVAHHVSAVLRKAGSRSRRDLQPRTTPSLESGGRSEP